MSDYYSVGARAALVKLAGTVDQAALDEFVKRLRYGDIINFSANSGDVMERSLRDGLGHLAISEPIRGMTGSQQHHTAMYAGIHPKTRMPMIIHNYERDHRTGLQYEPLANYADRTNFTAFTAPNVSDKDAAKSLGKAFAAMRAGNTHYPKPNAAAAIGPILATRLKEKAPVLGGILGVGLNAASAAIGRECAPGSTICSTLPVQSYGGVIGRPQANKIFAGQEIPAYRQDWSVTPATIEKNLAEVGSYRPANAAGGGVLGTVRGVARNIRRRFR